MVIVFDKEKMIVLSVYLFLFIGVIIWRYMVFYYLFLKFRIVEKKG